MNSHARFLGLAGTLVLLAGSAQAQFYKLHNADFGGSAFGKYTTTLHTGTAPITSESATDSFGGLFTLRDHPFAFAGVEVNYGYTEYTQRFFASTYNATAHTDMHEATAAYLIHPHFRNLQPFIGIGGGGLDFVPNRGSNQWRSAGLLEAGLDIPTRNPHYGFRVMGRSLYYRVPNYQQANLQSRRWVATTEPTFGFWLRY